MVAINYLWNPINDNIVREFDDAGNTIAEYTTEPDLYGNVVSQFRSGQTSYLLSDGQGNTTELTNDAGTVSDTIRYSAFAEVTERTGTTEIPFQFVGQQGYHNDAETGDYSVRQRPLEAAGSRWLAPEPLELNGEVNRYTYAVNSPLSVADPSGLLVSWRPGTPLPAPPPCVITTTVDYLAKCTFRTRKGSITSDIVGCVPGRAQLCCDIFANKLWPWWFGWTLISAQGLKKTTTYRTCWHWAVAGTGRVVAPPVVTPAPVRAPVCPGTGLGPWPFIADLVIFLIPTPTTTTEVEWTPEPQPEPKPEPEPREPDPRIRKPPRRPKKVDPCFTDYISCLHTKLADQGYGNRCFDCYLACSGLGGIWRGTMNGLDCAYWNYPSTE